MESFIKFDGKFYGVSTTESKQGGGENPRVDRILFDTEEDSEEPENTLGLRGLIFDSNQEDGFLHLQPPTLSGRDEEAWDEDIPPVELESDEVLETSITATAYDDIGDPEFLDDAAEDSIVGLDEVDLNVDVDGAEVTDKGLNDGRYKHEIELPEPQDTEEVSLTYEIGYQGRTSETPPLDFEYSTQETESEEPPEEESGSDASENPESTNEEEDSTDETGQESESGTDPENPDEGDEPSYRKIGSLEDLDAAKYEVLKQELGDIEGYVQTVSDYEGEEALLLEPEEIELEEVEDILSGETKKYGAAGGATGLGVGAALGYAAAGLDVLTGGMLLGGLGIAAGAAAAKGKGFKENYEVDSDIKDEYRELVEDQGDVDIVYRGSEEEI